jgi:hypothetical protein
MAAMGRSTALASRATGSAVIAALLLTFCTGAHAAEPATVPAPAAPPAAAPSSAAPEPTPPSFPVTPSSNALEAADTAAPGAVTPLTPPSAAPPEATPALAAPNPSLAPAPLAPRPTPIYQRTWFWSAIAVVVITTAIVGSLSLNPTDPAPPSTRLGDMHGF